MWITQNYTPFAVGGAFGCDRDARKIWLVAVRASFLVARGGRLMRKPEQDPVSRAPAFSGDPTKSSLLFDSDFPVAKHATDIIVNAEAYAPAGRPRPVVDVGIELGPVRKVLLVSGERVWTRGALAPALGKPQPFVSMPICYERAFGGFDPEQLGAWPLNPIGRGYAKRPLALLDSLAPNVEDPRDPLRDASWRPTSPAGFGAVAGHWSQRARYAGTYDERWTRERAPLWPEDFDSRYFQSAPADQQVPGFLRGGESCLLHNLTPNGDARFVLPKLRIIVTTLFADRLQQQGEAQLATVLIASDPLSLTMVWHAAVPCHDREHLLERSLVKWEGERSWSESSREISGR